MGPAATPPAISARDEELALIDAFLDRPEGPMALVLAGDAGIGKSTLWLAGIAAAHSRGHLVLASRPTQAEQGLAHVVVGDLFGDVASRVLPALPPPRRRALEQVLLIGDAPDDPIDPRTLGVAIHSALEVLAREGPLLLAIDDVQWVDSSSVEAVGFALRRSTDAGVRLLLARRSPAETPSTRLEDALDPSALERLTVGPLGVGDTALLLRRHLGTTLPRPTVRRLHEVSGGNPFYALEMARSLDASDGSADPTVEQPLPASIELALSGRFVGFEPPTRSALLLIAVHGRMSSDLLRAAGVAPDALDAALRDGIVERAGDEVRFAHSLLAAAIDQAATRDERRGAHALLASIVNDPIDRARHLAPATESPDAAVAGDLEEAVTLARARGWSIAAAELADHALRVTPPDAFNDRERRAITAAHAHEAAGDPARAASIADGLLRDAREGLPRARALVLRARFGDLAQSQDDLREALREGSDDAALRSEIHASLGGGGRFMDTRLAEQHARAALAIADALDDDQLRVGAMATLSVVRLDRGTDDGLALARQTYALARRTGSARRMQEAVEVLANGLYWTGLIGDARALLEQELKDWVERDEAYTETILFYLALVELSAGRWDLAADYDARARAIEDQYASHVPWDSLAPALIAVHRGDVVRAREEAGRGIAMGGEQGVPVPSLLSVLGVADLWTGRPGDAILRFGAAERAADQVGRGEPGMAWWRADHIEALLQLSRIDEAVSLLDGWETRAARLGRDRVLAQAVRCRGLVAAATGDLEQAAILLERAVTDHEAAGDPFGRARAQLALGVARRRARQQGAARAALEAALAGFETLGAATWVATARDELGRVGGRRHAEGLSAAEQRVAALVADGHTNQEVAAQLFLGERTVASHLTHVYAKLGVRSRTELAAMWRMTNRG